MPVVLQSKRNYRNDYIWQPDDSFLGGVEVEYTDRERCQVEHHSIEIN